MIGLEERKTRRSIEWDLICHPKLNNPSKLAKSPWRLNRTYRREFNWARRCLMLSRWPWFIIVIVAMLTVYVLLNIPCVDGPSCSLASPAVQGIWISLYLIASGAVAILIIGRRFYNLMFSYYAAQLSYIVGLFVLFGGFVLWSLGTEPDCNPCTPYLPYFIPLGNVFMIVGAVLCLAPILPNFKSFNPEQSEWAQSSKKDTFAWRVTREVVRES